MKNILRIFARDFKKISKNAIAIVVALGISILPSLYAWFNIRACWDPYGNTSGIKVAVANTDKGYSAMGLTLNVGDMVIAELAKNTQLGWQFVDKDAAIEGAESGKYYSAVVIPEDFSEKIASILTTDIQKPHIDYYVNEKKNAIAPKITDKGVGVIQQQVNETFISTCTKVILAALNEGDALLSEKGSSIVGGIVGNLETASADIDEFSAAVSAFSAALEAGGGLVDTTRDILPEADELLYSVMESIGDVQSLIVSSRDISSELITAVGDTVQAAEDLAETIDGRLEDAFSEAGKDAKQAASDLRSLTRINDRIIQKNNRLYNTLSALNDALPIRLSAIDRMLDALDTATSRQEALSDGIQKAADTVADAGKVPAEMQSELRQSAADAKAALKKVSDQYVREVSPQLNKNVDDIYGTLGKFSGLLLSVSGASKNLDNTLSGVDDTLDKCLLALQKTDEMLQGAKGKIDSLISEVRAVDGDEQLSKLIEIIQNDPEIAGSFMSSPVEVNTQKLYPIENYGSAMTPFYTILAIWVGGLILCAILKVHVREDDKIRGLRPYEAYFGRYLTFMVFGIVQSLIVCLGDLYFLKIQCENPGLFLLAGVTASIVFTNVIYTLTISFGDVGKAIAVILLVIQVAGAGGTFPIEVTPSFFNAINPYLPFTSGINAMRETVAGIYGMDYWKDMCKLLVYLPISLFVGLVLRKPLIKMNEFFERKLEETGLM